jgi:hypothetical protein
VKTAQQAAQNWQQSAGRAATGYQQGIEGYSGDWAGATVNQEAALLTNFQQSVTSGQWRAGVQAVGTAGWKSKTVAKIGNYSTGFSAGAQDQAAAIAKIMNALGSIVPSLPPRGTYEQNKTRATSLMDQLHALRGQLGAR